MSTLSNQAAFGEALSSLHRYVRSMHFSVEVPELDQQKLEEYFNCTDDTQNAAFDKVIQAAAVEAIFADPEIPAEYRGQVAARAARELVDAFHGAKVEYAFASGQYGVGQQATRRYERAKKEIWLCRKAAFLDSVRRNAPRVATKIVAKEGVKAALATIGGATGGPVGALAGFVTGIVVDAIWYLTPAPVKEKIKDKCGDLAQRAVATVRTIANEVAATPAFRKAREVVDQYVAPIVKPIYEKAREAVTAVTSSIGEAVRRRWKRFKAQFS